MGGTLGLVSSGLSLIGGLGGLFGGNESAMPQAPATYQLGGQQQADQNALAAIGQLPQYNTYAASLPQYQDVLRSILNSPYAAQYQQGSNEAAGIGRNVGMAQVGSGMSLLPYAQQILQQGFDPLGNVYGAAQQRNQEQTRAGLAARGLTSTPYGAGVENQSNVDFNNTWDMNALNRMVSAAAGGGGLVNNANNAMGTGVNNLTAAAALPYATAYNIGNNQFGALGQYGQAGTNAMNAANIPIQDWLQYLGVGNQAAGVANQNYANQITANQNLYNQNQKSGQGVGAGLQGIGSWFDKGGLSGLTSGFSGAFF